MSEKHPHPLIFMRGVQHNVLEALLDFIYSGETRLEKEYIDSLMKLSMEIGLFGLREQEHHRKMINQM